MKFMASTSQPAQTRQYISVCAGNVLMRHCGALPIRPRWSARQMDALEPKVASRDGFEVGGW